MGRFGLRCNPKQQGETSERGVDRANVMSLGEFIAPSFELVMTIVPSRVELHSC